MSWRIPTKVSALLRWRPNLSHLPPAEALKHLIEITFDYLRSDPYLVRLVMVENIHHGEYLKKSRIIQDLNLSAVEVIKGIYDRGVMDGSFRKGITPIDLHLTISALTFYNVSNRASVAEIFAHDMGDPETSAARRKQVVDIVLCYVMT